MQCSRFLTQDSSNQSKRKVPYVHHLTLYQHPGNDRRLSARSRPSLPNSESTFEKSKPAKIYKSCQVSQLIVQWLGYRILYVQALRAFSLLTSWQTGQSILPNIFVDGWIHMAVCGEANICR